MMSLITLRSLWIFLFAFLLISHVNSSWIVVGNGTELIHIRTIRYIQSRKISNFTSYILPISLDSRRLDTCTVRNPPPLSNGSVVLGVAYGGCNLRDHALVGQSMNSSVVILISGTPDVDALSREGDFSKVNVPLFLVDLITGRQIFTQLMANAKKGQLTYLIIEEDENVFYKHTKNGGYIFFQALLMLTLFSSFVIAIRAIFFAVKESGFILTVQKICLLCNIFSALFVFLSLLDPWGSRGYMNHSFVFVTTFLSLPCIFVSLALVSFFFNEILIQKKMMEPMLDYFKIPFLILAISLWVIYLSLIITIVTNHIVLQLIKACGIISLIYVLGILVYFTTVGIGMIRRLLAFKNRKILKVLPIVFVQSLATVLLVIVSAMLVSIFFSDTFNPELNLACWTIFWIAATMIIITQVISFNKSGSRMKSSQSLSKELGGKKFEELKNDNSNRKD